MPIVNGKEYAYTEEGIAAAEKAKKRSGFKMKYTNGKKADASAFPFAGAINAMGGIGRRGSEGGGRKGNIMQRLMGKINKKAEETAENVIDEVVNQDDNEIINQDTNEGLV